MTAPDRLLLLVDCDQFFVQCARLADPDGAGREELLLVGGRPGERGVVTSASYAARKFGVRSGMPMARALRLCPRARVVPVPGELCRRKSRDVRRVLERFSPIVAAASIDEAYLDLSGTEALYRGAPLAEVACVIQAAVHEEAGIRVSVGGGTTRVVAKLAAGLAKPAGVRVVEPGGEAEFMRRFQLRDIPGVGPVFARELQAMGLLSVVDALAVDEETLVRRLGEGRGRWLYGRLRGVDDGVVDPAIEAKSISREETYPSDLHTDSELERELLALTVRLGSDLRRAGLAARTITVRIRDGDFRTRQAGRTLAEPVQSDRAIHAVARELLAKLRSERRTAARLLGITLSHFAAEGGAAQLTLFGEEGAASVETSRDRTLSRAVDELRGRFGPDALKPARLLDP